MASSPKDAVQGYLFVNAEELVSAISRDKRGENLPIMRGPWTFQKKVMVGLQEPLIVGIDPEPVLRALVPRVTSSGRLTTSSRSPPGNEAARPRLRITWEAKPTQSARRRKL